MSDAHRLRVRDYLDHMLDATSRIQQYVSDIGGAGEFAERTMVHDAVVRNLEIIGEAARNVRTVDPDFAARHPSVPWAAMAGMRNRITHGYFDINLNVVWQTVQNDLPNLRDEIAKIVRSFDA